MEVDVSRENICINKVIGQKYELEVIEGDVIVPDVKPDILSAINTTGNICIYKREVLDGKIRIDGSVEVYIIYLADNDMDMARSLKTNIDFTKLIDFEKCRSGMKLDEEIKIKSIECKVLNGRKINVKVNLGIEVKVYSNEDVEIISKINNIQDVQFLNENVCMNSLVGVGESRTYAKDTIVIDNIDNLSEILKVNVDIINKDIKTSYNKVLAKADANIKILYLTEDDRINYVEGKIPIMGFVDIPDVSDENYCDMKYKIKNILIKPNNIEEHSIYAELEIELFCMVYEEKEIVIMQDLYSPTLNLNFTQKNVKTITGKNVIKDICKIKQRLVIPEINGNRIYDVDIKPNIINQNILNGKISYDGELELNFIFASDNIAKMDTKLQKIPFDFAMDISNINKSSQITTEIEIRTQDFIINQDGGIDSNIELQFNVNVSNNIDVKIIDGIEINEDINNEAYSMVIYFVKPGDTLWKIAKKFKSTVSDIVKVNEIENENKIDVGEQLFIPRFVKLNCKSSA